MNLIYVWTGLGLLTWLVALVVAGADRERARERRHKRRYRGGHRAAQAARSRWKRS